MRKCGSCRETDLRQVETVKFHVCAPEPFVHVLFRTIRHSARGILTFLGEFPFAITGLSGLSLESAIKYLLYPMRRLFMYPFRLASNGESAATAGATSANQPRPVPGMCSSGKSTARRLNYPGCFITP